MSKNAMAGAVTLCGVGLCVIGAALMMQSGQQAHAAAGAMPAAAAAVAATANAQAGPTVVWYGSYAGETSGYVIGVLLRAWSDGTIEAKKMGRLTYDSQCDLNGFCGPGPWFVISAPNAGFKAAADFNADEQVNAADLASILGNWGDAPRVPFPPSDCPLNLINP